MTAYQHRWHNGDTIQLTTQLGCSKVVCVGKNYTDHIKEMNDVTPAQPVLFLKPPSALCDANQPIKVSHLTQLGALHHELEIAVLIGKDRPLGDAGYIEDSIAGIGLGIDLTLRDLQSQLKKQGLPWERAKAFDGSCALSAFIDYSKSDIALDDIHLELVLNGKTQQKSSSHMMLTSIANLITEINSVFSLNAGDVVLTGTPAGVGPLQAGDQLRGLLNDQLLIADTVVV